MLRACIAIVRWIKAKAFGWCLSRSFVSSELISIGAWGKFIFHCPPAHPLNTLQNTFGPGLWKNISRREAFERWLISPQMHSRVLAGMAIKVLKSLCLFTWIIDPRKLKSGCLTFDKNPLKKYEYLLWARFGSVEGMWRCRECSGSRRWHLCTKATETEEKNAFH